MPRCLIVERHEWETGGGEQQIQIPLDAFHAFFPDAEEYDARLQAEASIFSDRRRLSPSRIDYVLISKYEKSRTARINGVPEIGELSSCYIFVQITSEDPLEIEVWWESDVARVESCFGPYEEAKPSQYGRGRRWMIVPKGVDRKSIL